MTEENIDDALKSVFAKSTEMPKNSVEVRGFDFDKSNNINDMISRNFYQIGFQATQLGKAIDLVNQMISWEMENEEANNSVPHKCKIFLGYTSNLVSSGLRDIFKFLARNQKVNVIVTTAGGIEEDIIKCLAPTYILGTFRYPGNELRKNGMNRIGNLVVPNKNYCIFEDWLMPILDAMLMEQKEHGIIWTPSKLIHRLGKEINNHDSIYYWCYKNNIPVYCPAITDGSLGDMIYFHSHKNPGLIIDLVEDIRGINGEAAFAKCTGMIILGGGVVKHHICNANLMRNGAEFSLYINTGQEFDGSDAGADPDEAISWGKIKMNSQPIKVYADATIVFPLLVAETFAKK